jgi:hypothetical protein
MKKKLRGVYLLLSSVFIYLVHLPFSFAKSNTGNKSTFIASEPSSSVESSNAVFAYAGKVYDSIHRQLPGLSRKAFDYAIKGMGKLSEKGKIANGSVISIADFSQPSTNKRLYVIDLKNYRVLFNTWVAHGRNSGKVMASSLSNLPSSFKSSPGFYVTGNTYNGAHGYSLRLEGVEKGINDNAFERAIVIHGADYVNPALAKAQGYIGRSLGCPAVPAQLSAPIIRTIKDGTCLFIYHPTYISQSNLLG